MVKFEEGKIYRTVGGTEMKVSFVDSGRLIGRSVVRGVDDISIMYESDGKPVGTGWGAYTLIMDDDRLDKLEAMCTDLFRQLRGIRESRNDGLATLNKGIDDLRQRIEGRFAKADEERALDVTATDARMDRLSGIINEYDKRIESIEKVLPLHTTRMGKIQDRVSKLEFEQGPPDEPIFRTIKGGWVNVWGRGFGGYVLSPEPNGSKEEARAEAMRDTGTRIACIRIPDFTEGEGL